MWVALDDAHPGKAELAWRSQMPAPHLRQLEVLQIITIMCLSACDKQSNWKSACCVWFAGNGGLVVAPASMNDTVEEYSSRMQVQALEVKAGTAVCPCWQLLAAHGMCIKELIRAMAAVLLVQLSSHMHSMSGGTQKQASC